MTTSTDSDEGTSNVERIASEARRASGQIGERVEGYRDHVVSAAIECYLLTAEHDEQRININQKYDEMILDLAREIGDGNSEEAES